MIPNIPVYDARVDMSMFRKHVILKSTEAGVEQTVSTLDTADKNICQGQRMKCVNRSNHSFS